MRFNAKFYDGNFKMRGVSLMALCRELRVRGNYDGCGFRRVFLSALLSGEKDTIYSDHCLVCVA